MVPNGNPGTGECVRIEMFSIRKCNEHLAKHPCICLSQNANTSNASWIPAILDRARFHKRQPLGSSVESPNHRPTPCPQARGFLRGAKWGLQPTGGPLSMTRGYPWGEENAIWGAHFHQQLRKRLGHSAMWGIIAEDLPEAENRVVLDPLLKDADGIPAPKLLYRMSENSRHLLQFHLQPLRCKRLPVPSET